ncbi:LOB domain-containing protein 1 [Linum perenne]
MSSNNNQQQNPRARCAGCKFLRRRCPQDCILAPYFPPSNPQRFAFAHKVFGASNVTKLLQAVPEGMRAIAADCISYEACLRVKDPVYGCAGIIYQLEKQIKEVESELAIVNSRLAFYTAQHHQQQYQQQQQMAFEEFQGVDDLLLWPELALQEIQHDHFN